MHGRKKPEKGTVVNTDGLSKKVESYRALSALAFSHVRAALLSLALRVHWGRHPPPLSPAP